MVLQHRWLINFQGKANTFLAIDMAQEHNIRDIKDTYRPEGPNSDCNYLKKISPAIPSIKAIGTHVGTESGVLSRGKRHSTPDSMQDIILLEKAYKIFGVYVENNKRKLPKGENYQDYLNEVLVDVQISKYLNK